MLYASGSHNAINVYGLPDFELISKIEATGTAAIIDF